MPCSASCATTANTANWPLIMGKVADKNTAEAENGLAVLEHPATLALQPGQDPTLGQILDTLLANRVIFVGEKHDRYAHHMNQLEIIRHLFASGADVAVGMEMFHQPFQPVVDDYLAGKIDEREFSGKIPLLSRMALRLRSLQTHCRFSQEKQHPPAGLEHAG